MADLEVNGLAKRYPTPAAPLSVLEGVDLSLGRGESLAIVGPSGSGKSTLLAILGTLDTPSEGAVRIGGVDPFALGERELARFRAERVGFVFQEHHLLPQCSVLENVLTPLLADGAAGGDGVDRAKGLLERVGLAERLTHRPAELSGGERQRVAIARAMIRDPLLLLADEPTGALDSETGSEVVGLLLELQAEREGMLVTVTHDAEIAGRMARTERLDRGRLVVET